MSNQNQYQLLLECYLSGQMTEKQWQEHLKHDVGFREWHDAYRESKREIYEQKFEDLKRG